MATIHKCDYCRHRWQSRSLGAPPRCPACHHPDYSASSPVSIAQRDGTLDRGPRRKPGRPWGSRDRVPRKQPATAGDQPVLALDAVPA